MRVNPDVTTRTDSPAASAKLPRIQKQRLREITAIVGTPLHLRRTITVALIVGTWLTVFNHGDELLRGDFGLRLASKIALDYLTPFVVSNVGLLARQRYL